MLVPVVAVVAAPAPVSEPLVPRTTDVVDLGQPEVPGGRRTVAVAGEYVLECALAFDGIYIFSFFARRQSAALQFYCVVMAHGVWLL